MNLSPSATPHIQISLFGTLQVVRGKHIVTEGDWHTRQARQLLKILVTERPRPVSTDRLIEILWSDSTPHAAATTLRSAINSLRNVLEPARPNRAPSRYIVTQMPGYAFQPQPDVWLDVDEFEHKLSQAQQLQDNYQRRRLFEEAVALYRDDYLISDPYADWAESERDRLRERYFSALLQLAELYAQNSNYTEAISTCRRILARDEVRENAYQSLMRYQAESGDSAAALLAYEKCRAILLDELGADPSPLTQTLHQRILNGEIEPRAVKILAEPTTPSEEWSYRSELTQPILAPPKQQAPPISLDQITLMPVLDTARLDLFVGREAELKVIERLLGEAVKGRGGLIVLEGEAGVGKSRLAYHVLQEAIQAQATVISTACQALEKQLPFAPLADSLGRYLHNLPDLVLPVLPPASLAQLAQILPSLQDRLPDLHPPTTDGSNAGLALPTMIATASENRQRLIDGLVSSLSALARLRPLVLFLDDLHWADADTLAVLGRLAQRLSDLPLLLLLAYRSDELAENEALVTLSHTLRRSHPQRIITLQRLTHGQVLEMVEHSFNHELALPDKKAVTPNKRHPTNHEQLAVALYHVTKGNALFVTEALRDLQERQSSHPATGGLSEAWRLHTIERSHHVQEIIEERISRLPEAAYSVLQVSAVIGRDFSLELLESAFPGDPLDGLEILLRRNFLFERSDQRLEFSHQVVCQATYDAMSHLQRRRWHLRVANALIKLHRDERNPGEVAFHFSRSGDAGRPQFAAYSVKSGEHLARTFGFRQAISAFDQALAILEATPDSPPQLVQRALQGRGLAYESLFEPEGMSQAYRRLQQWAAQHGDHALLHTTYSRLTTMLALFGQQRESNELLQEFLSALEQAGGQEQASASQVIPDLLKRRHLLYTPDSPDIGLAWSHYTPPPPPIGDPAGDLLRVLEPVHTVPVLCDYGWTLLVQGQLGAATQCLERVVDLANQTNQPSIASTAYHQLAVLARILGDPAQSQSFNNRSLGINRQMGGATAELASMWPRIGSAMIAIDAGQLDEAERRLRRVLDFLQDKPIYRTYHNSANIGLGLIALRRGNNQEAQRLLTGALADQVNFYPHMQVRALLGLAELEDKMGNQAAAATCLRRALYFAGRRSLLEEYVASVAAIVRLRPAGAPISELVQRTSSYVKAIGLENNTLGLIT